MRTTLACLLVTACSLCTGVAFAAPPAAPPPAVQANRPAVPVKPTSAPGPVQAHVSSPPTGSTQHDGAAVDAAKSSPKAGGDARTIPPGSIVIASGAGATRRIRILDGAVKSGVVQEVVDHGQTTYLHEGRPIKVYSLNGRRVIDDPLPPPPPEAEVSAQPERSKTLPTSVVIRPKPAAEPTAGGEATKSVSSGSITISNGAGGTKQIRILADAVESGVVVRAVRNGQEVFLHDGVELKVYTVNARRVIDDPLAR